MSQELEGTLINTAELIAEQTSDEFNYNDFDHKPQINGVELIGNKTTEDLGIDIPTKTSDLENDSGFITAADVPTKTSELQNDSGFITSADVPTKTSELENDSGFVTSADIPTKTSQLQNDSGFITGDNYYDKSEIDTALSGKADKSDTYTKTETDNKIVGLIDDTTTANNKAWSSSKITDEIIAILPTGTASGSVASFNTSLALPLVSIDVDNSATKIYQLGGNFFNKTTVTTGKLINGAGNEVSYADWDISDFVQVVEGASYYLYGLTNHPNTQQDNFELFDADKTKVGFANVKTYDQPYTIPSGVKYVKFSLKDSDIDTAQFGVSVNQSFCPYSPTLNEFDIGDTITTLIGVNNIFTDSGNVEVVYKKTINDAIAELQALILS